MSSLAMRSLLFMLISAIASVQGQNGPLAFLDATYSYNQPGTPPTMTAGPGEIDRAYLGLCTCMHDNG